MATDDVIWHCIKYGFCTFKIQLENHQLCRNKFNATGLCNRMSCPLSNSQYATVKNYDGVLYLLKKTIERQHMPKSLWEKIQLPEDFFEGLKLIDEELMYWPKYNINKCKQRLTVLKQYLLRIKVLEKKPKVKLYRYPKKVRQREKNREAKALNAAKLAQSIKAELLERLKAGTYGDIYNFPETEFDEVIEEKGKPQAEKEYVEAYDEDIMTEDEIEDTKIPEMEYEFEMEDGKMTDLTQEQVQSYVSSLGTPSQPAEAKPARKRKHIEIGGET